MAIHHPWRVVTIWVAMLAAAVALIIFGFSGNLTTEAGVIGNPDSIQGFDAIDQHFAHLDAQIDELVIVRSDRFTATDPEFQRKVAAVLAVGSRLPISPVSADGTPDAAPPTSADGHAVLLPITMTGKRDKADVARDLVAESKRLSSTDFDVLVTGDNTIANDLIDMSNHDLKRGELMIGLPVALIILLLVFGTFIGAMLPLLVGGVAIVMALGIAAAIAMQFELSVFLINMVSGMGLALGTDYSLFILSRYREERHRGSDRDASIAASGATASRAVLFSGITFVIALLGLLLVPTTIMRSLALAAILVGFTSVAAALTLLPALLRLMGDRVNALPLPVIGRRVISRQESETGMWYRIVRVVMRHPILWGGSVALVMLICAIPTTGLKIGASGVELLPKRLTSRQGYDVLHAQFPQTASSPAQIIITAPDVTTAKVQTQIAALTARIGKDKRFGSVVSQTAPDKRAVLLSVPVGADALSDNAIDAVRHLRSSVVTGSNVLVTGETAANVDYFDVMNRWTLPVFAFVLGLTFLVLMVVFRSLVLPLKAILLNLLSVGATYGLLVLVFLDGIGNQFFGFQQVDAIDAWIPLFLFSVLFGLSMDYHMFLLTRIRERWAVTGDTQEAVAWGVGSTGRIITGAALIIVAVFMGFAAGDLAMFQQMGFGVGVSLLIDATLVRGVLLPAAMVLLGRVNWYLPRWLGWLPELQLEAPSDGTTAPMQHRASVTR